MTVNRNSFPAPHHMDLADHTEENGPILLDVLIVDDEPNIRKTLSYCLAAEGHAARGIAP